ncbi:hypothetical protein [Halorarum salinum]|uniref:Uncharacterized protein n=1 Tax=Halorarum salinum TaxID=2743089 RepID=A0A7D5LAD1_9EURY|nr:hypothetical protein [Halobaculum salinum]QLG61973.1 hypothetical protein HUG12_09670 [Halobaculum salinum]
MTLPEYLFAHPAVFAVLLLSAVWVLAEWSAVRDHALIRDADFNPSREQWAAALGLAGLWIIFRGNNDGDDD